MSRPAFVIRVPRRAVRCLTGAAVITLGMLLALAATGCSPDDQVRERADARQDRAIEICAERGGVPQFDRYRMYLDCDFARPCPPAGVPLPFEAPEGGAP